MTRDPWGVLAPDTISLRVKDAARVTGVSEQVIRDAINRGRLPARRRGTSILILPADLRAWVEGLPPA